MWKGFELNKPWERIPVSECQKLWSSYHHYLLLTITECPSHTRRNRLQQTAASAEAGRPAGCCVSVTTGLASEAVCLTGLFTVYCELEEHAVWLEFVWNHVHWGTMPQGCWATVTVQLPSKIAFPANPNISDVHRKRVHKSVELCEYSAHKLDDV